MQKKGGQAGFTLIELLVVIAIIGLLAGIVLVAVNNARIKGRDARRLADVSQIQLALEMYYDIYGQYPVITADSCCDGWDQGPCSTNQFIGALETTEIMSKVPTDPKGGTGTGCYGYNYYRYGAGSYACNAARGSYYVLGVRDMETSGRPHPDSPGWSCPNRDWQGEFDWVTGEFEQ